MKNAGMKRSEIKNQMITMGKKLVKITNNKNGRKSKQKTKCQYE